jgi:uncharacterized tellurite resistance protein B-like protein
MRLGNKMNTTFDEGASFSNRHMVDDIMAKLDQPNGFAKLSPDQRKFLLGAILGSVVPADGKIKAVEVQCLKTHLQQKYNLNSETIKNVLAFSNIGLAPEQLKKATTQLQELLSIEDRTQLIGMLWDVAICDDELHSTEEALIYNVSDNAGVPRKRVAEQQAKSHNNRGR